MAGFQWDYAAFDEVLAGPIGLAAVMPAAEKAKARAEATAPVDESGPHPGRYKAAFGIRTGIQNRKTRRAYAEVYNDSPEAIFVEFGTKNNPRHRTLGKAVGLE